MRSGGGIICASKLKLVGHIYRGKKTLASKTRFSCHCYGFQSRGDSLLVGYRYPRVKNDLKTQQLPSKRVHRKIAKKITSTIAIPIDCNLDLSPKS